MTEFYLAAEITSLETDINGVTDGKVFSLDNMKTATKWYSSVSPHIATKEAGSVVLTSNLDIDFQNIVNRGAALSYGLPTYDQWLIQNQLVLDIKSNGIWNEEDIFYVFANNGSKEFSYLNWKDPLSFEITEVGTGMRWALNNGWNVLSTDLPSALNTNWDVVNNAVKFTQNDFSASMFMNDRVPTPSTWGWLFGARGIAGDICAYPWDNGSNSLLYWTSFTNSTCG